MTIKEPIAMAIAKENKTKLNVPPEPCRWLAIEPTMSRDRYQMDLSKNDDHEKEAHPEIDQMADDFGLFDDSFALDLSDAVTSFEGKGSPTSPHAIEVESAYREGFLMGAEEISSLSDLAIYRRCDELAEIRSVTRLEALASNHSDRGDSVTQAIAQAHTRGHHQAVAGYVNAIEIAEEKFKWFGEEDTNVVIATADFIAGAKQWAAEPISAGDAFFSRAPMAIRFFESQDRKNNLPPGDAMIVAVEKVRAGGGFIAEVIEHNLKTAFKPQPIFALAGALTLVGALIGRKYKDAFGTRSNIQAISVGVTTCGKDHARGLNAEILSASSNSSLIGGEEVTSDGAIYRALQECPTQLCQYDEVGRFLATTKAVNSPHLFNVVSALMKLYTSAGKSSFKPKHYADQRNNIEVNQPCLVLHGTSTPQAIYEAFGASAVDDGFLGRCLIFESKELPRRRMMPEQPIPESIIKVAEFWRDVRAGEGDLSMTNPVANVVKTTDEAMAIFETLEDSVHAKLLDAKVGAALFGRAEQKARQIALILACGVNHESPVIDAGTANLGIQIAMASTRHMVSIAEEWLSSNQQESTFKRVLRLMKEHPKGLSSNQLTRNTRWLKPRERAELINDMVNSGQAVSWTKPTSGRPKVMYCLKELFGEELLAE